MRLQIPTLECKWAAQYWPSNYSQQDQLPDEADLQVEELTRNKEKLGVRQVNLPEPPRRVEWPVILYLSEDSGTITKFEYSTTNTSQSDKAYYTAISILPEFERDTPTTEEEL